MYSFNHKMTQTIDGITESLSRVKGLKERFYAGDLDGKIQAEELG